MAVKQGEMQEDIGAQGESNRPKKPINSGRCRPIKHGEAGGEKYTQDRHK